MSRYFVMIYTAVFLGLAGCSFEAGEPLKEETPADWSQSDRESVIEAAAAQIGKTEYEFGAGRNEAERKEGIFDCSSFVHWAFDQEGMKLGSMRGVTTDTLKHKGKRVSAEEMQTGDLVFFDTYKEDGHVGIYIGNGEYIGAQESTGAAVESLEEGYWSSVFNEHVRRI